MITDYTIRSTGFPDLPEVYERDQMFWLNRNQLEHLFHVNKSRMETLLEKANRDVMCLEKQCITLSVVIRRKSYNAQGYRECVKQVRHYSIFVIEAILELEPSYDAEIFLMWAKKELMGL